MKTILNDSTNWGVEATKIKANFDEVDRVQKTTYKEVVLDSTALTLADKYYFKTTGVLNTSTNYKATPLLQVDKILSITSGGASSAVSVIAFFDTDEVFISAITAGDASTPETLLDIAVPENAKYAGFSCANAINASFSVTYYVNETQSYRAIIDANTSDIATKATALSLEPNYVEDTEFSDLDNWGIRAFASYSVTDEVLHIVDSTNDSDYLTDVSILAADITEQNVHISAKVKLGAHGFLRGYVFYTDASYDEFIFDGVSDIGDDGFSEVFSNLLIDSGKTLNYVSFRVNGVNMLGVADLGIYLKEVLITSYSDDNKDIYSVNKFFKGNDLEVLRESKLSYTSRRVETGVSDFTINLLGNSIIAQSEYSTDYGKGFISLLCEKFGINKSNINNYGVGGNRLTIPAGGNDLTDAGGGEPAMCVRYADMTDDADFVFVMGGANDVGIADVGALTGNYDKETFAGALRTLIEGLLEKYRGKPIVYGIQPRKEENVDIVNGTREYAEAAIQICKEYGVITADFHNESGICDSNIEVTANLADSISWTSGKRILYGELIDSASYSASGFISASEGDEFARNPSMDIAFYDSGQNYIDGSWHSISVSSIYGNFVAPTNTSYVRASILTSDISASTRLFKSNGFTINDGVHPNTLGNKKMAGLLYRIMQQFIFE